MKKSLLGMIALATVAMTGCTQDDEQFMAGDMGDVTFTGVIEEADTRTSMDSYGKVIWTQGDPISIFMRNGGHYKYAAKDGGSASTTFAYANVYTKGTTTLDQNYAVYPYAAGNSFNGRSKTFTVDLSGLASQSYTENTFETGKSVMTAQSGDTNLPFYNALSMLLVQLNTDVPEAYSIKSIEVASQKLYLNGSGATITLTDANEGKAAAVLTSGNKANTLDCTDDEGNGIVIGTDYTGFYILVPANEVEAGDVTITITAIDEFTGEETEIEETISKAFTFERSKYVIYKRTLTGADWTGSIEADQWDGTEGETWDDEKLASAEIEIYTAQDLADFAATVNGGNSLSGKTVKLMNTIDLQNYSWTPIGLDGDGQGFAGIFDGQGNSISNLYIDTTEGEDCGAGLFGSLRGTVKNLTISSAVVKNFVTADPTVDGTAVVAGAAGYGVTIENVKVVNATVTSNRYVGAVTGFHSGTISGCTVDNVKLEVVPNLSGAAYDNGDKAGGLAGYINSGSATITNNTVSNFTIKGYRDMGGLVGWDNGTTTFTNNKVSKGTISIDRNVTYVKEKDINTAELVGYTKNTVNDTNTAAEVTIAVNTLEALNFAASKGYDVLLSEDVTGEVLSTVYYGNTPTGAVQKGGTINGDNKTLTVTQNGGGEYYGIVTYGGTIKDITIKDGFRAVMIMNPTEKVILENVVCASEYVGYFINTGGGDFTQELEATGCTFKGWGSYTNIKSASFKNCSFGQGVYYGATSVFGRLVKPYVTTVFENCEFEKNFYIDLSALLSGHTVTLKNCKVDGQLITDKTVFADPTASGISDDCLASELGDALLWLEKDSDSFIIDNN